MIVEDQCAATEFRKVPPAHGLAMPVGTLETHISRIFLAAARFDALTKLPP